MQDTINKQITVKAPRERVYNAIADPKQIVKWFPDSVDGTFEVGERPLLTFGDLKTRIYVEAAKPFEYFAYRWIPGGIEMLGDVLKADNTLVEFFIEEAEGGTKVTLKESGFASLPADHAQKALGMMNDGWTHMMGQLEKEVSEQ